MGGDGIEELRQAVILERLRGSEHEPVLQRIGADFLEKGMDADIAQAVFNGAITAIRTREPNPRIKELGEKDAKEGLTESEYDEFRRLIVEGDALKQRRMPPFTML